MELDDRDKSLRTVMLDGGSDKFHIMVTVHVELRTDEQAGTTVQSEK